MKLTPQSPPPSREHLLHLLYEAAEFEHTLMCTYLYAAFSLRHGETEGLSVEETSAIERWRRIIMKVAVEEMGHLTAVWNITAALGGSPRFGRGNFPLDPGTLPAGLVVKLAPSTKRYCSTSFTWSDRSSAEPEGEGFEPDFCFTRGNTRCVWFRWRRLRNRRYVLRHARCHAPSVRGTRRRERGILW